jgi:hypothetical protein
MAKNVVKVDLKPIRDEIRKVQSELRKVKPQASLTARKTIDLDIKRLDDVAKKLAVICKGKMTHAFAGSDDDE